jgi:hypothetical protein
MVTLGPPEFAKVTDCIWLLPTGTGPKLMLEGFAVSVPEEPVACEVSAKMLEKKKSAQNPHRILLRLEPKFFTARPLVPR